MKSYILSIDQSTSSTKAILFDPAGKLIGRHNVDHRQYYPEQGWVEHDAEEIYLNTIEAIKSVLVKCNISESQLSAIAITNQRETAIVWDRLTGKPVYNAIVWQCTRAEKICERLISLGYKDIVKSKTGLVLSTYFSAAKIKWILDNVEGVRRKAEKGLLLAGTMDCWLLWNLTDKKIHATDFSNACRTQLFNINELKWDEELLDIFSIPRCMLPQVKSSNEIFGYASKACGFDVPVPVAGIMGDSHAALFGQNCYERGMAKATYGTGSSVMMNIGKKALESEKGLVTSIAWGLNGIAEFVFEANINCTGAAIKWLADDIGLISNSSEAGKIASSIENNGGVYLVPAFSGLAAPYWDGTARASITGMTLGTKKAHIIRAAEESIAYQIKDVLDLMKDESGIKLKELHVDGGPTMDDFLMQFQADILDTDLLRPAIEEFSAYGSALAAGLATGIYNSLKDLIALTKNSSLFRSSMPNDERNKLYAGWTEAVKRTLSIKSQY